MDAINNIHFHTAQARDTGVMKISELFRLLMFHSSLTKTTFLPTLRNLHVSLSLNSYKPKKWAYVTFNSQKAIDSALVVFQLLPLKTIQGHSYTWDPVAKLKECFNINQPFHSCQAAGQCSHFRSKSHDRSASASHHANAGNQNLFSPDDANNILTLLCELRKCTTALELANQRMSHIELHLDDSGPTPMQEDPSVTHVLVNLPFSSDYGYLKNLSATCYFPNPNVLIPSLSSTSPTSTVLTRTKLSPPLLWVIYINPLLTVLKNSMMDPYVLSSPLLTTTHDPVNTADLRINNLVFMDDSTLISLSKASMELILFITEEFYFINNTSANHRKYVLTTNSLPLTSA
ncbi:hypothetical protein RhiirC2_796086 [Rhizophagus irregularis]|uniref:RRM domain-containing protein n=1 Tax=Rhizophagus irregularis TaxID=588596 RepID=A0A2N1MAC5_9GLOM|nr:hypothetical protein RhiirC2_796086 [Rhizophagus irregularis]